MRVWNSVGLLELMYNEFDGRTYYSASSDSGIHWKRPRELHFFRNDEAGSVYLPMTVAGSDRALATISVNKYGTGAVQEVVRWKEGRAANFLHEADRLLQLPEPLTGGSTISDILCVGDSVFIYGYCSRSDRRDGESELWSARSDRGGHWSDSVTPVPIGIDFSHKAYPQNPAVSYDHEQKRYRMLFVADAPQPSGRFSLWSVSSDDGMHFSGAAALLEPKDLGVYSIVAGKFIPELGELFVLVQLDSSVQNRALVRIPAPNFGDESPPDLADSISQLAPPQLRD